MRKQVGVLGLGVFGKSLALALSKYGVDVIAIDKDLKIVEEVADEVTYAVVADFCDVEQLKEVGIADCEEVIIASGQKLEKIILALLSLQQLNVKNIIVKVTNEKYITVLKKLGAQMIIQPEKNVGETLAKKIVLSNSSNILDLDQDYSVLELEVKDHFINKSLADINFRKNYGLNVIGIRDKAGKLSVNFDGNRQLIDGDKLLVLGQINDKEKIKKLVDF